METKYDLLKIFDYIRSNKELFIKTIEKMSFCDIISINIDYDFIYNVTYNNIYINVSIDKNRNFDNGGIKIYENEIIIDVPVNIIYNKIEKKIIKYIDEINNK